MKKLKSYEVTSYQDSLWHETTNLWCVKQELMKRRYPARLAKSKANQMLSAGIQYWRYNHYDDI